MIQVRNITLELAQVLESGEEQTIIIEVDGSNKANIGTEAWTNDSVTISDLCVFAFITLEHARIGISGAQLETKP